MIQAMFWALGAPDVAGRKGAGVGTNDHSPRERQVGWEGRVKALSPTTNPFCPAPPLGTVLDGNKVMRNKQCT